MVENLRQLGNFIRYVGLIVANKANLRNKYKKKLLKDYLRLKILGIFLKAFKVKTKKITFLNNSLKIFDFQTTISLIESIFIENEYYFKTNKTRPVIIDLGSNIGLSIIYFKLIYPKSIIQAFEPDSATFKLLEENKISLGFKDVTCFNLAITNKTGTTIFYTDNTNPGSPLMSLDKERFPKDKISVNCSTLSNFIKNRIDFVKMDIEGAEAEVLLEIDNSGKISKIDQISVEYHHHIHNDKDCLSNFLEIIENNNFGYQIHASQNTPFSLKTFEDIQIHAYNKTVTE